MINIGGFTGLSNSIKIGGGISSFNPFRMIDNGILINATFERAGDVVALINTIPVVFGPNEPVVVDGRLIHHGAITETTPTYDISPIVRPTAPDIYDPAASAPNPDKHGVNWEFSDPRNKKIWDLLDGVADGVDVTVNGSFIDAAGWALSGDAEINSGSARIYSPDGFFSDVFQETLTLGVRYQSTFKIISEDIPGAGVKVGDGGLAFSTENIFGIGPHTNRFTSLGTRQRIGRQSGITDIRIDDYVTRSISPATGTLILKPLNIVPDKTQWQTVGDFNILSGDDNVTVSQILYIEQTTGLICATDGTNTCKSATEYIAGTDHQVDLIFNGSQMAIVLDGVQGTASAFTGHFPVGATIKQGFENEDVWSPGDIYGQPGTPVIL